MLVILAALFAGTLVATRENQVGASLDLDGITVWRMGGPRRWSWDEVLGIDECHGTYLMRTRRGDVWLAPEVAHRIVRGSEGGEAQAGAVALTPEQIEAEVGLQPGEAIRLRTASEAAFTAAALGLVGLWVLVGLVSPDPASLLWYVWLLPLPVAELIWLSSHPGAREAEVVADGPGLRVRRVFHRRWLETPWALVAHADPRTGLVTTDHGRFAVPLRKPAGKRIFDIVERVLAARKAGAQLPDTTPVPAGAISRMTGDASAERGISEAEVMNEE